jgi:hypothetical protein
VRTREPAGTALVYQHVFLAGISVNDYVRESEEAIFDSADYKDSFLLAKVRQREK